ncbi:YncE family protein [Catenulispora pinisilvae]|uniref:YncE family protein n=1 Tax=Catenulispora pinisilvae TaxID=2705253 RepID=UPI0018922537|nr:YncE family protein [Catenulispora pinisilvae]
MVQNTRAERTGDVLAAVSQSGPTVSFFDAASDRLLGSVEVLAEPHEICFDPTRRLLWCTNTYEAGYYRANSGRRSQLAVIDPDARRIVEVVDIAPEVGPHGLSLDAERGRLYVSVEGAEGAEGAEGGSGGGVVIIDTASRRPIGRIDTGAFGPHWFVASPDGTRGYASNKEAPFVSVLDLVAGELIDRIEVPGGEGLAVSADGSRVYVAAPFAGGFNGGGPEATPGIRVIDTGLRRVVDVLATDNVVVPVHVTATGKVLAGELRTAPAPAPAAGTDPSGRASRPVQAPGRLTVFSADTHKRLGDIEMGRFPLTITSSPDGALAYAAGVIDSTVDVIDLETLQRLARLELPKLADAGAHGLAYIPKAA